MSGSAARRRRRRRILLSAAATAVLSGCVPSLVQSSTTQGTVGRPASVIGRDVGISAEIAGQVTWLLGDTILNPPACDGGSVRSSTAGIDPRDAIVGNVVEPVDACGAPAELVSPGVPPTPSGARTAFWPEAIVPTLDGRAAVFYQRVLIDGLVWTTQATSVAEMAAGATTLDRSGETVLFGPDERSYVAGNLVAGGNIYLYATELQPDLTTAYYLARVPQARYRDRSAYTFWDGAGWSTDAADAARLRLGGSGTDASGGLGGLTVSWNPYLGRYLMVHTQAWAQDVLLRTAARPEGPWSAPTHLDVPDSVPDAQFGNYSAREHPHFRSADGRTIVLTYHRTTGWLRGDLPIVKVVLRRP